MNKEISKVTSPSDEVKYEENLFKHVVINQSFDTAPRLRMKSISNLVEDDDTKEE